MFITVSRSTKFQKLVRSQDHQPGKHAALMVSTDEVKAKPPTVYSNWPRGKVPIIDNYCVAQRGCVGLVKRTEMCVDSYQTLNVDCIAVNHVPFVAGLLQKKGIKIKFVKGVSCVD